MPVDKTPKSANEQGGRIQHSYQLGYLRGVMIAMMVIWIARTIALPPNVAKDIVSLLVGWVVWQAAGRMDERMDLVAEKLIERFAPYLPSGTRKR